MSTEARRDRVRREPPDRAGSGAGSTWVRFVRGCSGRRCQPIAEGRLRDVDWPFGLRAIVAVGYGMFALAGVVVILSARCGGTTR